MGPSAGGRLAGRVGQSFGGEHVFARVGSPPDGTRGPSSPRLPAVSGSGGAGTGLWAFALWAVLFAAYGLTLALGAAGAGTLSGPEPHHLDVAAAAVRGESLGRPVRGLGFPLLVAPAWALGGTTPVQLFLAAVAAAGFVAGAALARVVVPNPWATRAALLVGLSPPALAHAVGVYPEMTAGSLLAGAALCAARVRERPQVSTALTGAGLLAVLPWLAPQFVLPAVPVAVALVRWTARRGRRVVALGAAEVQLAGLVFYLSLNDRLYGGVTPWSRAGGIEGAIGAELPFGPAARLPRLATVLVGPDAGMVRWAPVLALAGAAAWLLVRSRRARLGRLIPERREAEHVAALCLAVVAAQLVVAALVAPAVAGPWFAGRHLAPALAVSVPLVAWGLQHWPRTGAVLGALTAAASVWVLAGL